MPKYDDASWHYEGTYPSDLPNSAASTHIGMFVAWLLLHGHASEEAIEDIEADIARLQDRSTTPGDFLVKVMDEKFDSDDFSDAGNAFAVAYYQGDDGASVYFDDVIEIGGYDGEDVYRIANTWETYDALASRIEQRFRDWVMQGRPEFLN